MQTYTNNEMMLKAQYVEAARTLFNKELGDLNPYVLNSIIAHVVKSKAFLPNWNKARNLYSKQRIAMYCSMEFLIGRVVLDVLNNMDLLTPTAKIFAEYSIDTPFKWQLK